MATTDKSALEGKVAAELHQIATDLGIEGHKGLKKAELVDAIVAHTNGERADASPVAARAAPDATVASARTRHDDEPDERPGVRRTPGDPATAARANARSDQRTNAKATTAGKGPATGWRPDAGQQQRDREGGPADVRPARSAVVSARRRRQRDIEMQKELHTAPTATGLLDVLPEGYGFLRTSGYLPGQQDIYVSLSQVRRFMLRKGDTVTGKVRQPKDSEKYFALLQIDSVNGMDPEEAKQRPNFDKLTPLFPNERFHLETGPTDVTGRIMDMVAPIGKGQRGMVVSPPKAGKTTVLKNIASGINQSSPDTHVMVLLVDERPEEVTDWQRTVQAAEVVYSTFDKPPDQHIQVTELVLERAKRLAEMGQDVAIILDSITRLARAYNLAAPASGKILSGGIDSTALYPPRRFFGAARNIEEGGSVTIIASALVETGSRMDEGIFEEFKGTGNMELRLDRQLAEKRLFPAINVEASSTRKEELLMPTEELALVWRQRRVLHALEPGAALELLTDKIRATKSNEQFLREIAKAPAS